MKSKDYYEQIQNKEQESSRIKKQVDREMSSEERKIAMAERVVKIEENKTKGDY